MLSNSVNAQEKNESSFKVNCRDTKVLCMTHTGVSIVSGVFKFHVLFENTWSKLIIKKGQRQRRCLASQLPWHCCVFMKDFEHVLAY